MILALFAAGPGPWAAHAQKAKVPAEEYVSIDFDNVDIKVFIKFISKLTGKNFVVDSRVKGKVTVISPTKISVKEAYQVFESVLEIHGFSTVHSGKVTKIIPSPSARADNLDTRVSKAPEKASDRLVTRLIPLDYADTDELKRLFTPLLPKGSVVLSYKDTNMLIVTATLSSIERILKIIRSIDVPSIGKRISVIPVENADAAKLAKTLSTVFKARIKTVKGKAPVLDMVTFTADERTNAIILLASKVETQRAKELIELLDQQVPKGDERIRVYYLEHALAEDMAKVLQKIPTEKKGSSTAKGKKEAPILSQKVNINADPATNSLIIMAEKEDYPVLEEVIAKLDIPRAMVYIECLIMEVNVTKGLNIGTEWQTTQTFSDGDKGVSVGFGGNGDSGFTNSSTLAGGSLPKGFSVGVLGKSFSIGGVSFPDIKAVVNALQTDEDVNILSTPQILTTENEEAVITVGSNIPYQTRSAADSGTETYSSYEYKDVGITLKITPRISKGRMVRLDVFQELTKLTNVNQDDGTDRPTTLKRQIETTIIVEDANSVVIGGLIDETMSRTNSKTPCLGDVPGLGWAFKSVVEGEDKTNLYVFLTPRVIKSPLEARDLYNDKKKEIDGVQSGEVRLFERVERAGKIISGQGGTAPEVRERH
ncbi:MAG: type II secretion system secretin GspD [Desulfobacter sp.]|nr:MAG: type II secretion system secretin GspD [Desulfobacter sp.]